MRVLDFPTIVHGSYCSLAPFTFQYSFVLFKATTVDGFHVQARLEPQDSFDHAVEMRPQGTLPSQTQKLTRRPHCRILTLCSQCSCVIHSSWSLAQKVTMRQ